MPDLMQLVGTGNNDLYDEVIRENLNNRVLIFNDEVNDCVIENYILYIMKWNREDKDIEDVSKRRKITLILNSIGGDSMIGFGGMVNCIEQSKTPIVVVGIGLVASMAFHIFIACKERVSFKDTIFLMHDGVREAASSGSKFKDITRFFDNLDNRTKQHVLKYTTMTEEFYDDHLDREFYMYADEAKEFGCVDHIIGDDYTLDDIF